jgi:hypothetical protein
MPKLRTWNRQLLNNIGYVDCQFAVWYTCIDIVIEYVKIKKNPQR